MRWFVLFSGLALMPVAFAPLGGQTDHKENHDESGGREHKNADPAGGSPDALYAKIPFEQWLTQGDPGHFRWTARASAGELSNQQRLRAVLDIQVDGNELVSRRGHGALLLLIQMTDAAGHVFQTHQTLDLNAVKDDTGKSNVVYSQFAFVTPGDYRIAFGIADAQTGEHGVLQRPLHVATPKNDPLPKAWEGLPSVEFGREVKPPDDLLLPYLGRLHLPLRTKRALRLELLVNASPASASRDAAQAGFGGPPAFPPPGNRRAANRPVAKNLGDVMAAMKVMSGIDVLGGTLRISLLDIARRKLVFEQEMAGDLDWPRLRGALQEADPNKIDVRSLAGREQNGQFFVEQVRGRLLAESATADPPAPIVIVLSGPMPLNSGEDLKPIQLDARSIEAAGLRAAKVFFVRYHSLAAPAPVSLFDQPRSYNRRGIPLPAQTALEDEPQDSLVSLLKPLQPRVFDVYSPEQFRKALATLLDELAKI